MPGTTDQSWWQQYLPLILAGAGAGTSLLGAKMGSNAQNQANQINQQNSQQAFQLAQEERQKKDALSQLFLPIIMNNLGIKNPALFQQGMNAFRTGGGATPPPQGAPQQQAGSGGGIVPMQGVNQMQSLTDPYFPRTPDGGQPRQLLRM